MNKNILIVLGGGFVIALLVAIIVQVSFGSKNAGMIEVAVAAKPLKTGDPVTEVNFKWQGWPKESISQGVVVRDGNKKVSEQAVGKIRRDMNAGEPLSQASLTAAGKGNALAAAMDAGNRAMAIKVSPESMVGGFVSPGDRVDVILTFQVKLSGDERDEAASRIARHGSQTVLENVKVLAIDQLSRKDDDKAKIGRTVTLEVSSSGAEKLALVSQMGDLSLVLRALGDDKVSDSKKIKPFTSDVEVSTVLQELGQMKKNSGGKSDIVRVYNGQDIENVKIRQ